MKAIIEHVVVLVIADLWKVWHEWHSIKGSVRF